MKFSTVRLLTVGAIVMIFATSGEAGAEPERSGWYIGGGIGANWTSRMDQEGLEPGHLLLSRFFFL